MGRADEAAVLQLYRTLPASRRREIAAASTPQPRPALPRSSGAWRWTGLPARWRRSLLLHGPNRSGDVSGPGLLDALEVRVPTQDPRLRRVLYPREVEARAARRRDRHARGHRVVPRRFDFLLQVVKPVCASVRSWATAFASVCADPYSRRVVANLV